MRLLLLICENYQGYMCLVLNHCLMDQRGACDVCKLSSSSKNRLFLNGVIYTLQDFAVEQLWDDGLSTQLEGEI
jgi:hypothetical protein